MVRMFGNIDDILFYDIFMSNRALVSRKVGFHFSNSILVEGVKMLTLFLLRIAPKYFFISKVIEMLYSGRTYRIFQNSS